MAFLSFLPVSPAASNLVRRSAMTGQRLQRGVDRQHFFLTFGTRYPTRLGDPDNSPIVAEPYLT
jgi:hypothetical protein